jgi:hypothetical protein
VSRFGGDDSGVVKKFDGRATGKTAAVGPWFDLIAIILIAAFGFAFLSDAAGWAAHVYIGHDQFGDADFWWQGALQLSRGVFWENVNIAYRMGYALFAGSLVALFGPNYDAFHNLLLLLFLGVAAAGYLISARSLGRILALALITSLVFSPFQAEWLAISTSDALGLIWNLISLFALWRALDQRVVDRSALRWLAVAGIFLGVAALTRPLMTFFIAPAALLILILMRDSLRARAIAVTVLIGTFVLPLGIWMSVFYVKTGQVGMAGHDASIFYAASTQQYQVWTPTMYPAIEASAKARLGVSTLAEGQLDQEFRRQTLANYQKEYAYHLRRLPAHVLVLTKFSFQRFNSADRSEIIARLLIRGLLTIALVASCLIERRWLNAVAVVAAFGLSMWMTTAGLVVIAAALIFLLPIRGLNPINPLISTYWWTGIAALYLSGGTIGPPLTPQLEVNALGYRLGSQFLFANEWLVILGLLALSGLRNGVGAWLASRAQAFVPYVPPFDARRILRWASVAAVGCFAGLFLTGTAVVGFRGWQLIYGQKRLMPATEPLVSAICAAEGNRQARFERIAAEPASVLLEMWGRVKPDQRLEGLHLLTGASGGLLWQMDPQWRTRALFYQQDLQSPFAFGTGRTDIEFAGLVPEDPWRNRQGAWFFRSFREVGPQETTFDESLPRVQMFVPLSADGAAFDYTQAIRFPLARPASALAYAGRLKESKGQIEWVKRPGSDYKRRWFSLIPRDEAGDTREAAAEIDLADALGDRKLRLLFRIEPVPDSEPGKGPVAVSVDAVDASDQVRPLLSRRSTARDRVGGKVPPDDIALDIPRDATRVRVTFTGLNAKEIVRVGELQLISDDVAPGLVNLLCADR